MIEHVPGATTEEGEEQKGNTGRFQMIHSPVHKRPLCDKRATERERTRQNEKKRERALGRKKPFERATLYKMLLNKIVHLISKSN